MAEILGVDNKNSPCPRPLTARAFFLSSRCCYHHQLHIYGTVQRLPITFEHIFQRCRYQLLHLREPLVPLRCQTDFISPKGRRARWGAGLILMILYAHR